MLADPEPQVTNGAARARAHEDGVRWYYLQTKNNYWRADVDPRFLKALKEKDTSRVNLEMKDGCKLVDYTLEDGNFYVTFKVDMKCPIRPKGV